MPSASTSPTSSTFVSNKPRRQLKAIPSRLPRQRRICEIFEIDHAHIFVTHDVILHGGAKRSGSCPWNWPPSLAARHLGRRHLGDNRGPEGPGEGRGGLSKCNPGVRATQQAPLFL